MSDQTRVIICCGVGGVGKTTTSAAVAAGHALAGRRVVVMTIDPARRLADALGVEELGNEPQTVHLDAVGYSGEGRLDAMMLDRKATFDAVIRTFSPDAEAAQRLLDNRYYRAVSERLGGAHEYMAMEKLYELVESGRWDVVVVDTPPTQHALDFFRAPDRVRKVFDRSVLKVLLQPGRGLFAVTTRKVAELVQRLVGESVIADIGEFFQLIGGMSQGFRDRSQHVDDLLHSERTHYFLVASASAPDRTDALAFLDDLRERGMQFSGFLVNRVADDPGIDRDLSLDDLPGAPDDLDADAWREALHELLALVHRAQEAADRHQLAISSLRSHAPEAPVWEVPDLGDSVRSMQGLARLSVHLPPHDAARS